MNASLRSSDARLNGSCGAIQGAASAPATQASVSAAAATVTGERRKLHARSWSQARRNITRGLPNTFPKFVETSLHCGEAGLPAVIPALGDADVLLHRPGAQLVVQRHGVGH